ncbi:MFS transporter [Flexivirga oryzae]|uniref:MFS family permease n=1 Tax=Flexivirga oryzae TaxID=1794944 RepID=A0A839MZE6_9MICO|nr:MFS transporter [Flexivirga oryzae]MBB2890517.1 MFS family permease [Flexivirga oryzae]
MTMTSTDQTDTTRIWHDRGFLTYWTGYTVSALGDQVSALALPLVAVLVFDASAAPVSLLTALLWLPYLFSLFVGTWVDHHGRQQRLLIAADLCRCLGAVAVPTAYALGGLTLATLYGCAVVLGSGSVLGGCSGQSFFVRLVPKTQYVEAHSVLSSTLSLAALIGPAVGGVLVQAIGAADAITVDAATFLVSAVAISRVRTRMPAAGPSTADGSYGRRLGEGVRYLVHHPYLRASLMASTAMNLGDFTAQGVLILFASRNLQLSPGSIGLALSVGAIGGLTGALTARRFAALVGTGRAMVVGGGLSVLPYATLAVSHGPTTGFVCLAGGAFVAVWAVMQFDINNNSVRATVTDDAMRGRVAGAYSTINYGSRPVGALLGGLIATVVDIRAAFVVAAVFGLVSVALMLRSPMARVRSVESAAELVG